LNKKFIYDLRKSKSERSGYQQTDKRAYLDTMRIDRILLRFAVSGALDACCNMVMAKSDDQDLFRGKEKRE